MHDEKAEMAEAVREWRGNVSRIEAAKTLGMSVRTLEGVENGKGFNYPELLKIAMQTRKAGC